MSTLREAAQQALEALDAGVPISPRSVLHDTLRAALAQQEQEQEQAPAAQVVSRPERVGFGRVEDRKDVCFLADLPVGTMLYTAPPRREWRGLTEEEIQTIVNKVATGTYQTSDTFARAVEQACKEKNNG